MLQVVELFGILTVEVRPLACDCAPAGNEPFLLPLTAISVGALPKAINK